MTSAVSQSSVADSESEGQPGLLLLNGFSLFLAHKELQLPIHAQRVLAFLAIARQDGVKCSRQAVIAKLWADSSADHGHGSLRTALWRIRSVHGSLISARRSELALGEGVVTDLQLCRAQAARLLAPGGDLSVEDTNSSPLTGDLLPEWDEDWLLIERERLRQVQLHALEALAVRLRNLGRYPEAIDAALRAKAIEPLRESVHAVLIDICLDEGNVAAAHEYLRQYTSLLWTELGLRPSPRLLERVRGVSRVPRQ